VTVDIVIVNWNGGPELLDAIASGKRFGANVIVVDNASTTGVVDSLDAVEDITLIRNPTNSGFAAASNLGAAAGSGDIVFLLNPDAEIIQGSAADLERAVAASAAMVFGMAVEQPSGRRVPSGYELPGASELLADLLRVNALRRRVALRSASNGKYDSVPGWIVGAAVALRRVDWDRLGGMDAGFFLWYEDVDLGARIAEASGTVAMVDALRVRHIGASTWNRLPRRRRQWLRVRGATRYAAKHLGRGAQALMLIAAPFALAIGIALDVAHFLARR
jgi:N-acetylglucosaminyl-diphospho-decaprenol L-rhamnosyltransferase